MTMTDEPTTEPSAAAEDKRSKKAKKGRSNLLPALVLAAGIAAGGYYVGAPGADAGAETDAATEDAAAEEVEPGVVVELEPMTLNLDGGRFLRVGVAVLTTSEFESFADDEGTMRLTPDHGSQLRDQLIAMFAGRQISELTGSDNLDDTKAELLDRANEVLDDQALEVYLTEFVTQ
ncbi:MAG: flagellar basal body-associated FliL family protein [Acidimicrobiales bacterium]|nr:flagellar basal body-associated FliL family protein [Acidimicrobiales bacterium]